MSINDITKEYLKKKYTYLLQYFCNINSDKLCNELSYNKSGHCIKCKHIIRNEMYDLLEQYNKNEQIITDNIQNLFSEYYDTTKKNINETNKEYKTKNMINIFEIIYYNMFFVVIFPKFLITIANKITEIIKLDKDFIADYINKVNYKKHIFEFICDMNDFINNYKKNKNINIDVNMTKENFELFLDSYIKFIETYYDNNYYKKIHNDIDIDNINNLDIIIEL